MASIHLGTDPIEQLPIIVIDENPVAQQPSHLFIEFQHSLPPVLAGEAALPDRNSAAW